MLERIFNSKPLPKVSTIIPVFNEEKTIGNILKTLMKIEDISQVIVVDDGSKDNTYRIVNKFPVKLIKHKKNKGKGAAMKSGVKKTRNDIVLFLDGDLKGLTQKNVTDLITPVQREKANFTKGRGNFKVNKKLTKVPTISGFIKPLISSLFPKYEIYDPLCGLFCIEKDILEEIEIPDGWAVDVSILLDCITRKEKIKEVHLGDIFHDTYHNEKDHIKQKKKIARKAVNTILEKYWTKLGL